ncbi:MAG: hypothetical protein R2710_06010 [Acidimicrobiales bacterium]
MLTYDVALDGGSAEHGLDHVADVLTPTVLGVLADHGVQRDVFADRHVVGRRLQVWTAHVVEAKVATIVVVK